jgi:serine/threonine-protein kinase
LDIDVGQVIAGKYELVKLLGKGAMGEVWLAHHNSLGGEFAIKLIEPNDDIEAETTAGRFQLEAQIAAKLSRQTRHIVSVSDHGEENGLAYLVMERLEGESLETKSRRSGSFEVAEVAAIVSQVARALSLAHEEGIFHRDLKPANVWLGRDEDGRLLVKLLDFGIARSQKPFRTRSPFATSKDMVLGTPSYMSPEQARGLDTLDYRCDLWALAVVAYEALTTKIPFEGETVEDVFLSICTFRVIPALTRRPDLPPEIEAFFARAFAPRLDDRFQSALELAAAFEQLVAPEQLEAALGIPLTPTSARRLDVMRGKTGSQPDLGIPSARGSQPDLGSQRNVVPAPPSSNSLELPRGSSPDFENVALGDSTIPRRSGSTVWLIATLAIIALFGIGTFVLVSFRRSTTTTATQPPDVRAGSASAAPPSTTAPPVPSAVTSEPASAATPVPTGAKISTPTGRPKSPTGTKTAAVLPAGPSPATAPPGAASPTTATHPPATAPTSTTGKSVNKGEVF